MVKINSRGRIHGGPNEHGILKKKMLCHGACGIFNDSLIGSAMAFSDSPTPEFLGMVSQKEMLSEERED